MADKDPKKGCLGIDQIYGDTLNARIGVLTRREVEARILAPVMEGAAYCDFRYTLKKGS